MAKAVTLTDIDFKEARLWSEVVDAVTHLYVSVGYSYVNANNIRLWGERTIELTGTRKTTVAKFFTDLKSDILTLEGI